MPKHLTREEVHYELSTEEAVLQHVTDGSRKIHLHRELHGQLHQFVLVHEILEDGEDEFREIESQEHDGDACDGDLEMVHRFWVELVAFSPPLMLDIPSMVTFTYPPDHDASVYSESEYWYHLRNA